MRWKVVSGKKKEGYSCYRYERLNYGAAAISIYRLLLKAGFKDVTLCDRKGAPSMSGNLPEGNELQLEEDLQAY